MLHCKSIRIANRSRWLPMHDITCVVFLIPEVSLGVRAECAATQNNKILANLASCFAWAWKQESKNELLAPACDTCLKASFFESLVDVVFHSFFNISDPFGFYVRFGQNTRRMAANVRHALSYKQDSRDWCSCISTWVVL